MPRDDSVTSERLVLPLLTASRLERLIAGDVASVEAEIRVRLSAWWTTDLGWLLRVRLRQIGERPEAEPWLLRPIALRSDVPAKGARPEAIGLFNFHGPPDDRGFVEVGYELLPPFRGQGYAIEAVRSMLDWAVEQGVNRFRAAIAPENDRSVSLVRKLGMERVGAQWDEDDGLELIYTVDWDPQSAASRT
jgi:RimJ/RimL family protein N-acetyltransferase